MEIIMLLDEASVTGRLTLSWRQFLPRKNHHLQRGLVNIPVFSFVQC